MLIAGLIDVLIIGGMALIGRQLVKAFLPQWDLTWSIPFAFPLGASLISFSLFLASLAGLRLAAVTLIVSGLFLAITATGLAYGVRRAWSGPDGGHEVRSPTSADRWVAAGLGVGLLAMTAFLSVGRSYSTWDAMAIWGVKGYGIGREGTVLAGLDWGAHGLSYPLNIPILVSVFRILEGDQLPGSKVIFSLFLVSLALATYGFFRRARRPISLSGLAATAVATIPIVFEHGTIGYANLAFACLLVLGSFQVVEGFGQQSRRHCLLGALLFALAIWTRPEGLVYVVVAFVVLLIFSWRTRKGVEGLTWLTPVAVVGGVWVAFTTTFGVTSTFSDAITKAGASLVSLQFNLVAFYWIFRFIGRQYLTPAIWGLAAPLALILFLANYGKLRSSLRSEEILLLLHSLVFGLLAIAFYYVMSFHGDIQYWLGTGIERMMMPATLFALIWAFTLVDERDSANEVTVES